MLLYLARHGNTFAPGETPVMVGRKSDLWLVDSGQVQARALGTMMAELPEPRRIIAGNLKRAKDTARLMARAAGWKAEIDVDERLMELDYGGWEGKSDADLTEMGESERMVAWRKRGIWPEGAGWSPEPEAIVESWRQIARNSGKGPVLAVSSNGVLRFALELIPGAWAEAAEAGTLTMRTGAMSVLDLGPKPKVLFWDRRP